MDAGPPELLSARTVDPYSARFILRIPRPGPGESPVVLVRNRFVGDGLHEDLDVTNHGPDPVGLRIGLAVDADFADVFEVKSLRAAGVREVHRRVLPAEGLLEIAHGSGPGRRATEVRFTGRPAEITEEGARFAVVVPPRSTWHTCIEVCVNVGPVRCLPACRCDAFGTLSRPLARRAAAWRARLPALRTAWDELQHLYRQGCDDLAALLMDDPDGQGDLVVAAGLPWFMTLFGRDAILTALMTLPFDRELAGGVLRALARHQGRRTDPATGEAPGKILHEVRSGEVAERLGRRIYYGTVDATPLFVILVAEARRWGLPEEEVRGLLPNVRRAVDRIREDLGAGGYLTYPGRADGGLRNQGWKDSWDAVRFADGTLAEGPIALCEVQGYAYRALLEAAELLEATEPSTADQLRATARELAARFRRDFWLEAEGYLALALDGQGRRVDAIASNAGHVLWTGILEPEQEAAVARRLLSDDLFSGWGLRTFAASNRAFNPVSYHLGSVWPHDTAIAAAGLARAGSPAGALALIQALVGAAPHFGYRLPELFSGFAREPFGFPVGYPTTSSPQAWAAASVLLILRTLLGLDADLPAGFLRVRPIAPAEALPLALEGLSLGRSRLRIVVGRDGGVSVRGAPRGLRVVST